MKATNKTKVPNKKSKKTSEILLIDEALSCFRLCCRRALADEAVRWALKIYFMENGQRKIWEFILDYCIESVGPANAALFIQVESLYRLAFEKNENESEEDREKVRSPVKCLAVATYITAKSPTCLVNLRANELFDDIRLPELETSQEVEEEYTRKEGSVDSLIGSFIEALSNRNLAFALYYCRAIMVHPDLNEVPSIASFERPWDIAPKEKAMWKAYKDLLSIRNVPGYINSYYTTLFEIVRKGVVDSSYTVHSHMIHLICCDTVARNVFTTGTKIELDTPYGMITGKFTRGFGSKIDTKTRKAYSAKVPDENRPKFLSSAKWVIASLFEGYGDALFPISLNAYFPYSVQYFDLYTEKLEEIPNIDEFIKEAEENTQNLEIPDDFYDYSTEEGKLLARGRIHYITKVCFLERESSRWVPMDVFYLRMADRENFDHIYGGSRQVFIEYLELNDPFTEVEILEDFISFCPFLNLIAPEVGYSSTATPREIQRDILAELENS